jgi:hypothetical protein
LAKHTDLQTAPSLDQLLSYRSAHRELPHLTRTAAAYQHEGGATLNGMFDERSRHPLVTQLHNLSAKTFGQLLGGLEIAELNLASTRAGVDMYD